MKKQILILCFTVLFFAGCRKSFFPVEQKVYFQSEYINYAWGYQHSGFFVDVEGNVLVYDKPEGWNFHDENMILTADQLIANLGKCSFSGVSIPVNELQRYASYIPNIASSKLTSPRQEGADMGTFQITCYQLMDNGKYKAHLISQEGDFTRENLNFYSKRTAAWIKEIGSSLPRK